jgi:hypothetical protein
VCLPRAVFGTPSIQPSNLDKKPISEVLAEFAKQVCAALATPRRGLWRLLIARW